MPRILIVYASTHGHTAKIADRIAVILRDDGNEVEVSTAGASLDGYDAVVVGASIHAGHHQRELVEWARYRAAALGALPSAFFSVCLTAADEGEESRAATRAYLDDFQERTGWAPRLTTTFAGALQYREYDFVTRLLMRLLMKHGHHPTDASRDYDYTDWDAVAGFARECGVLAAEAAPA